MQQQKRVKVFDKLRPSSSVGKIVVVPPSFEEFLLICGRKLGIQAFQAFLEDNCEIEDVDELKDGDKVYIHGVKEDFPEEGESMTLSNGSFSKNHVSHVSLAEGDFRRTVAGALGSIAKRLDGLATQTTRLEKQMEKLMETMSSQNALINSPENADRRAAEAGHRDAQTRTEDQGEEFVRRKAAESVKTWRVAQTLEGHTGPVWCLVEVEERHILISGSSDTTIKIWDIFTFKARHTLKGHQDDKSIRIWDLNTIACKKVLQEHEDCVVALAVSTDKRYLFSGSYHQVRVWDLKNEHKCVKIFTGHNHWVRALHVAESYLFSGCHNMIKIWDTTKLELVRTISTNGIGKSIYSCCVVGQYLLAGCFENMIQVWDLKSFEMIHKLSAHRGAVYCLEVQGNFCYSGSYDNTVRVWDLRSMECVQVLKGHTSKVEAICAQLVQAQTPMLFTASSDHSVKVWTQTRYIDF